MSQALQSMALCGEPAETGEELKKRFKRAVVGGGRHKGARYSDLPASEIHRCAKAYRGDARFHQYCKQWVSLHMLDDKSHEDSATKTPGVESSGRSGGRFTFTLQKVIDVLKRFTKMGTSFALIVLILGAFIISRPAFSTLCAKVLVLSIREVLKKSFGLIAAVVDGLLDEAVAQVDVALNPTVGVVNSNTPVTQTPTDGQVNVGYNHPHWAWHLLSLFAGLMFGRHFNAMPAAQP